MKTCIIAGAGEFFEDSIDIRPGDFVIAADGGFAHLKRLGIKPDLLVGDFDSLAYAPAGVKIKKLLKEKDETDTAAAVEAALEEGCRTFRFYGCTGGRFDHTLANMQLLVYLSKNGAIGYLYGKDSVAVAVTGGEIAFDENKKGFISVFSAGEKAEGVTLKGLKYPLMDAILTNDSPIGVSNEFTGAKSSVAVKRGTLIIIYDRDKNV